MGINHIGAIEGITLQSLFSHWAPGALQETVADADKLVARHGSIGAALQAIAPLAGGNVSLRCSAHFQPIERVLRAIESGAQR